MDVAKTTIQACDAPGSNLRVSVEQRGVVSRGAAKSFPRTHVYVLYEFAKEIQSHHHAPLYVFVSGKETDLLFEVARERK